MGTTADDEHIHADMVHLAEHPLSEASSRPWRLGGEAEQLCILLVYSSSARWQGWFGRRNADNKVDLLTIVSASCCVVANPASDPTASCRIPQQMRFAVGVATTTRAEPHEGIDQARTTCWHG